MVVLYHSNADSEGFYPQTFQHIAKFY